MILIITMMGAVFTLQRQLTGSLTLSILTHWFYNAILVLGGMLFQLSPE